MKHLDSKDRQLLFYVLESTVRFWGQSVSQNNGLAELNDLNVNIPGS